MSRQWGDGRYEARALLGRGGTAEVWRAGDRLLRREVAVKSFVASTLTGDAGDAERFRAEIRLLARLDHPHVIRVLDAGVGTEAPWYAMQLADAGSLARPGAAADPAELRRVGVHVADALAYLHGTGIVHRDVKPSNILLDGERHTYLSDFGVAQVAGAERMTTTGRLVGTVAFLAPEQVRGEQVGPPADVYALGLVLLERLTGRREYPGPPAEAAVARLVRPPSVPLTLPVGWADLLSAMTAADPAGRPCAAEVRDRLAGRPGRPCAVVAGIPRPGVPVPGVPATTARRTTGRQHDPQHGPQHRTTPAGRSTGVAVLGGAVVGGGLVALLLTGGVLGPFKQGPRLQPPAEPDQVQQQVVAGPVTRTTDRPRPRAVRTTTAEPIRRPRTTASVDPADPPQTLLSDSPWDLPVAGALEPADDPRPTDVPEPTDGTTDEPTTDSADDPATDPTDDPATDDRQRRGDRSGDHADAPGADREDHGHGGSGSPRGRDRATADD